MTHDPGAAPDGSDGDDPAPDCPGASAAPDQDPASNRPGASAAPGSESSAGPDEDDGSWFGTWEELEGTLAAARERAELLAGFAPGGQWDVCAPGPELAAAVARAVTTGWGCPAAGGDELVGLLRAMARLHAWSGAGMLGVVRALIRDDALPIDGGPGDGSLPDRWDDSLTHEVALALAVSVGSAGKTMRTAWELGARLPGVELLLRDGTLDVPRARLVAEVFEGLSDADAARAEALLLPHLAEPPRKTWVQVQKLAAAIAAQVDPGLAERSRKSAERHLARVRMFREPTGAAGLSGRDLPTDQTLAAYASVAARALAYKESGEFPGATMDRLRATAYLDLLNNLPAEARIAYGRLSPDDDNPDADFPGGPGSGGGGNPGRGPGSDDDTDHGGGTGPGSVGRRDPGGSTGPGSGTGPEPGGSDGQDAEHAWPPGDPGPALTDLVIPLATLLGLAERPGEGHGLGPLDPALCRALAALAARSPRTELCVTVTDQDGIAIGHGCAVTARTGIARPARPPGGPPPPPAQLPARINLTITAGRLTGMLARPAPPGSRAPTGWALAPPGGTPVGKTPAGRPPRAPGTTIDRRRPTLPADPGWCGTWTLTLPAGPEYAVTIGPVPTFECDHRNESHAYKPNHTLRHLVQVRDHTCTFPTCNRHARESDFEHALPYDQGGRTCACNAGARSRRCHRVKQSPGWTLTQPQPGWHQWTTPRDRTYTQGPKRYPV